MREVRLAGKKRLLCLCESRAKKEREEKRVGYFFQVGLGLRFLQFHFVWPGLTKGSTVELVFGTFFSLLVKRRKATRQL
jgi:hypothetical protein